MKNLYRIVIILVFVFMVTSIVSAVEPIYYTATKELVYKEEIAGKITKTKTLTRDNSYDAAGVTSSGDKENSDVYFILNKRDHIAGEKGKKYYLVCTFLSGYISNDAKEKTADQTIPVELDFTY